MREKKILDWIINPIKLLIVSNTGRHDDPRAAAAAAGRVAELIGSRGNIRSARIRRSSGD